MSLPSPGRKLAAPRPRVGNYRLLERLAEGGMSVVYLAEHLHMGHRVAIKLLRRELFDDRAIRDRFVAEGAAMTRVRHPNVAAVLDVGVEPDHCYLVLELLPGETLAERLSREGPRPPLEVAALGLQLSEALRAAHDVGVIHRDLKPANVQLVPLADGSERAVLLDFGLAKLLDAPPSTTTSMRGAVWGTPPYMSPEQGRGDATDRRSDVYALACLLYELCVGRPPFTGAPLDVLCQHQLAPRPRVEHHAPRVPRRLADLLCWMMAIEREARPVSMAVVSDVLAEVLRPSAAPRAVERPRRRRPPTAWLRCQRPSPASLVIAAALLLGAWAALL